MEHNHRVIGIDIGGTKISAALFRPNGDICRKEIQSVQGRKGKDVLDQIGALATSLVNVAKSDACRVRAIGVGVPGIYDPVKKTAWAPNIPNWDHIALWDGLADYINDTSIKLSIESDRSCYILGEVWKGSASGCTDAIFVAVGTGIGAGILSDGRIISGRNGIAGAVGWLALEPFYNEKYNTCGNFEYYASGNGISRSTREILKRNRSSVSLLDSIPESEIRSQDVFDAFEKHDPVAVEVMKKAITYWGMTVANLTSIFNPQKIIFGGGVFGPATSLLDQIFQEAKQWAQPLSIQQVSLEPSALQGDAGLYGAGYLAIKNLNELNETR